MFLYFLIIALEKKWVGYKQDIGVALGHNPNIALALVRPRGKRRSCFPRRAPRARAIFGLFTRATPISYTYCSAKIAENKGGGIFNDMD